MIRHRLHHRSRSRYCKMKAVSVQPNQASYIAMVVVLKCLNSFNCHSINAQEKKDRQYES